MNRIDDISDEALLKEARSAIRGSGEKTGKKRHLSLYCEDEARGAGREGWPVALCAFSP